MASLNLPRDVMRVLAVMVLCLLCGLVHAQPRVFVQAAYNYPLDLAPYISTFEDPDHAFQLDQVMKLPERAWSSDYSGTPSFGFTRAAHWVRLTLENTEPSEQKLLIELFYPLMDTVELYYPQRHGAQQPLIKTGDALPFSSRQFMHRNFIFPITLAGGETAELYWRMTSRDTVQIPMRLWDHSHFHRHDHNTQIAFGLFYGSLMTMVVFNLLVYFAIRQISFLYYVVGIVSFTLAQATLNGLSLEYLAPNMPELNKQIRPLMICSTMVFGFLFSMDYLETRQRTPVAHHLIKGIIVSSTFFGLVGLALPFTIYIQLVLINTSIGLILMMYVGVATFMQQFTPAKFFLAAWSCFIVGVFLTILRAFALLPSNMLTEYGVQFGSMLVAFLLSYGLSERLNHERKLKFAAQASALESERLARIEQERATRIQLEAQEREFQARQLTIAAKAESKAKGDFLATMSHEIRTPMNGVLGVTQLLFDTKLDEQQQHYVDTILKSGQSLLSILNDVLDFSKIEAGKMTIESIDFDLEALADDALSVFGFPALEKGLELNVIIARDVPRMLRGDPTRLRQVLLNLIGNALKFTARGEVFLHITRCDGFVRFAVYDTGIGIAKDIQKHLFDTFSQADNSTTRRYGGTGLGLAISKKITELMGGQIGVDSEPGQGSCFWFTVRCQPVIVELQPPHPLTGRRLLLIDEHPRFVQFITEQCHFWGMELTISPGPNTALALQNHDVILCKVQFANALASLSSTKPVLYFQDRNQQHAKQTPECLIRPLPIGRLTDALLQAVGVCDTAKQEGQSRTICYPQLRVLVAEDNSVNQMVIKGALKKFGINAEFADNGQEALDKIKANPDQIDLILMDCEMPIMDGYQATLAIREFERQRSCHYSIVGLSAHAVSERREKAFEVGMDDYITKPVQLSDIQRILTWADGVR